MNEPEQNHMYIIGIGGVGTVWLADWLLAQGWRISGSDMQESAVTRRLEEAGVVMHYGCDPGIIPDDVTEAVVNSAITPTSPSYPEYEELQRRRIRISKRAQWIGKITRQKYTIAVSGTHGKTSTTAMVGWILEQAGLDPTVFVGGTVAAWGGRTRIGTGKYLVIEADEYDRSFHHFYPQIAILLNIDTDHTDYYSGGITEIMHAFRRFLRNLPFRKGMVVAYGKDGRIRQVCRGFSYTFRFYDESGIWPGLRLPQPGIHMALNATAAARVAHEIGVPQEVILKALQTFPGVGRRFEQVGSWGKAEVYDDYAHHPREIAATLAALAERFPDKRRVVVFQPHQKARTKEHLHEFAEAFRENPPERLILAPIYEVPGREADIEVSHHDILAQIHGGNVPVGAVAAEDVTDLERLVRNESGTEGVIMVMGAGSIRKLAEGWMNHE